MRIELLPDARDLEMSVTRSRAAAMRCVAHGALGVAERRNPSGQQIGSRLTLRGGS